MQRLLAFCSLACVLHAGEPVSLFDGKTLNGWEGDPTYWRVENGCIVGEVTPDTLLKRNSFLIWRAGTVEDFELTVEYRVSDKGNSGINYRSIDTPDVKWALTGYQADIDGGDRWTGQNYEERGRTFLAYRGESVVLEPGQKPKVVKQLGTREELQKSVKKEDWNTYRIVAKGNLLQHYLNDVLMSEVNDLDPEKRKLSGLLGVQVHVGPPMKIEYRKIDLVRLDPEP
ncbi:glycosylhydrolase [Haloferula helveola]|uniref:Glycosylhydrolase n=1 Tax=Haloferula helveola TaxID=490095 RepID=A0ABM7RBC1_9BACT|nr:glycosylhydrolase [Haloferula helveola]